MIFDLPPDVLAFLLPTLLMSLTIHEYAHARTALYFGDYTAKANGRVTFNPIKHLDLFGTLAILFVGFGWAKPVPVNPVNMRNRPFSEIMVSLAGPGSNLLLAIASALGLRAIYYFGDASDLEGLATALFYLASINIILCVFNLLPVFPLDGHHILREFLPAHKRIPYMYWQMRYGFMILLVIVFGPQLLSRIRGQHVFDPLDWVFDKAELLIYLIAVPGQYAG